jgi:hypothetical protein
MNSLATSVAWVVLLLGPMSVAASRVTATHEFAGPAGVDSNAQTTALPRFEDYSSIQAFAGRPAPVVLASARYGRTYRTRLRDGAQGGPNFAGAFTVITWGCGSSCQVSVVVNARTGVLSQQTLRTTNGVEFRRDSRLLIADPVHTGDPPLNTCAACGVPAAYEWTGARFEPVGLGPHPHLATDQA